MPDKHITNYQRIELFPLCAINWRSEQKLKITCARRSQPSTCSLTKNKFHIWLPIRRQFQQKAISTHLQVFPKIGSGVGPGTSLYGRTFSTRFTVFALADVSAFCTKFCACMHGLAVSNWFVDCVVVANRRTMQLRANRTFFTDFISTKMLLLNTNCCNLHRSPFRNRKKKTKKWNNVSWESSEYKCIELMMWRIEYVNIKSWVRSHDTFAVSVDQLASVTVCVTSTACG